MYTVYYFKDLSETTGIRIMRSSIDAMDLRWTNREPSQVSHEHEHEQRTDAVRVVCAAFFRVLRYVYFKFMFNNEVQTQEKSQSRKRESRGTGRALAQLLYFSPGPKLRLGHAAARSLVPQADSRCSAASHRQLAQALRPPCRERSPSR